MKKTIILTALLGALVLVSYGQSVTLYNTNIVDVENGKIIPGMTVSVKDGIITKIAKAKKKIKISQITDQSGITTVCMKIRTLVVSFFILSAI